MKMMIIMMMVMMMMVMMMMIKMISNCKLFMHASPAIFQELDKL